MVSELGGHIAINLPLATGYENEVNADGVVLPVCQPHWGRLLEW